MPEPPIVVAMSGGLDSSAVAALLADEGRNVIGMTMQLWNQRRLPELAPGKSAGRCCSLDDVYDARLVAGQIGIPFYVVNFEQQFEERVVAPFVSEYLAGRTPIPCTLCNNFIKFDQFLAMADTVGAEHVATGHYARVTKHVETGRYELRTAVDSTKDQTYFLFGLTQQQLARTLFPLGDKQKTEVRELARSMELPVAEKPESYEICFVPNNDYAAFLSAYLKEKGASAPDATGSIVSSSGTLIGKHEGVHHFTVGQRKGLGVAAGEPLYVISTDAPSRQVTVGKKEALLRSTLVAQDVNWVSIPPILSPRRAQVRIRHRHQPAGAMLYPVGSAVEVRFEEPQRAIAPGQAAVFYDADLVLGGGWIKSD